MSSRHELPATMSARLASDSIALAKAEDQFRVDIQALRGLAILLVVLQHSRLLTPLKAGYLGVDIFFVISGYLITGIIQRELQAGTFRFTTFYVRRAKRLLPAAYVTFAASLLLSPLILTRAEMQDFMWQLLGAVSFTGNIALWLQTGYFETAAHLKPLLHVWSLSIEEQYYALLPAALVFSPRRLWRVGAWVVGLSSLALCLALALVKPGATFYLLPTRAWELALGSLGVLALQGSAAGAWLSRLFWPSAAALLVLPFFPIGASHPGLDAVIICTATLAMILRRHPLLNHGLPVRTLARMGDISYSLYLVHWPLLAFAANAWVTPMPGIARFELIVLAFILAFALFRWVEQPLRRSRISLNRTTGAAILAASSVLVATSVAMQHAESTGKQVDYRELRRGNVGLSDVCEYGDVFIPRPECQNSSSPRILVWGDSYAMHLVDGIAASTDTGLVQATKTTCGPLLGISSFARQGTYNRRWAQGCISFNDSVLSYLAASPSVEVVVMSSLYGQYLTGTRILSRDSGSATVERDGSENAAAQALRRSIVAVRALGKRVVLVAPPPSSSGIDIGRCLERKAVGKIVMGVDDKSCSVSEASYRGSHARVRALIDRVSRDEDVGVIHLDDFLCKSGTCAVEKDGVFLYRDQGHLSHDGSRLLGREINLAALLIARAR